MTHRAGRIAATSAPVRTIRSNLVPRRRLSLLGVAIVGVPGAIALDATAGGLLSTEDWRLLFPVLVIAIGLLVGRGAILVRQRAQHHRARAELERQLDASQKLEGVGRLVGGIAHDFNNLLTAVTGYAELARLAKNQDELDASVDAILDAGERAASLTRQLHTFSREHAFTPEVLDTRELIRTTEALLRHVLGAQIEMKTEIDPASPPIFADPSQMNQVLLNLAINARDAMPNGGRLTILAEAHDEARAGAAPGSELAPGRYCRIRVRDTGAGMSEETKARLFERFFTTKEPERGTGLGLSTTHGIITEAGGSIRVDSSLGQGTTFEILLPAAGATESTNVARPRS